MAKSGESIVKKYLENKSIQVVKIPETSVKTVDFAVYYSGDLFFYLEEKTIELAPLAWKNVDPIYNAIGKHIYEAAKQFQSINPGREVPNVLSFTNMDPARSIDDLFTTLTGHVITSRGKLQRIEVMKKLEQRLSMIDLFLWFDQDKLVGHIGDENNTQFEEILIDVLDLEY